MPKFSARPEHTSGEAHGNASTVQSRRIALDRRARGAGVRAGRRCCAAAEQCAAAEYGATEGYIAGGARRRLDCRTAERSLVLAAGVGSLSMRHLGRGPDWLRPDEG